MKNLLVSLWLVPVITVAADAPVTAPAMPAAPATINSPVAPAMPAAPSAVPAIPPPSVDGAQTGGKMPTAPSLQEPSDILMRKGRGMGSMKGFGGEVRDPTAMPERFRNAMKHMIPGMGKDGAAKGGGAAEIPEIHVAGKSVGGGGQPTAILQIEKRTYLVRQGSQVTFPGSNHERLTVRVESIDASGVELLLLPNNERLFLN